MAVSPGCGNKAQSDPIAELRTPSLTGSRHLKAMEALDQVAPTDPDTLQVLKDVVAIDRYRLEVREAALDRLAQRDLAGLKMLIRLDLPNEATWPWLTRLSQIIAERGWVDLTPALVSSWSRPAALVRDDLERPEYAALAKLHGSDRVTDVVFELFLESKGVTQQGLRARCWDLLHRLGQRQRLVELLSSAVAPDDDAFLIDLRAGASELGIVPRNKEEVLWLRKLREPKRAEFWSSAVASVQGLSSQRRLELELRDLPILVSASLHDPELLKMTAEQLHERVDSLVRERRHYVQDSNFEGVSEGSRQRLYEYRGKLTWGDLAAMLIALRAVQVPQVIDHLFDYAQRDRLDESTEYGGVIALDDQDRFEIKEFPPAYRRHDQEFIASQAMFDAGYTSIFHFHNHCQNYRNDRYAGPGFGDVQYADSSRANCLVLTFINESTLNVDFYRHGRVVVDLGEIKRE